MSFRAEKETTKMALFPVSWSRLAFRYICQVISLPEAKTFVGFDVWKVFSCEVSTKNPHIIICSFRVDRPAKKDPLGMRLSFRKRQQLLPQYERATCQTVVQSAYLERVRHTRGRRQIIGGEKAAITRTLIFLGQNWHFPFPSRTSQHAI